MLLLCEGEYLLERMYYEEIFRELNKKGVRYLVVGGVALVLHGVVRFTADLDLMVDLNRKNLIKFIDAIESLGYKPKVPVKASDFINPENRERWKREKNMKVFSFYHPEKPFELVDVFVDEPIDFNKAHRDRKVIDAGGIKIPTVSVDNLKKLKTMSGRGQDLADIKSLKKLEELKNEKEG